jgi:hypothetical protein
MRHLACATALIVVVGVLCTDSAHARKKKGNVVVLKVGEKQIIRFKEFKSVSSDNPAVIKVVRDRKRGGFILIPRRRGSTTVRWTYKERGSKAFRGKWKYVVR